MKKLCCLLLILACLTVNAQKTTKQSIIVRDSVGVILSINENEYRNDSIVRTIHYNIDESGCKTRSFMVDYSKEKYKDHTDSILTYYVYKGTDSIKDKIVTFSYDTKKKLLMSQSIHHVNKIDVVYPAILIKTYKYNRKGKVVKVIHSQKNGNKTTSNYIEKVSYGNNNVTVKRFFFPSYNRKGEKVLIPKREYELCLISTIDDDNRVIYQQEKRLAEKDVVGTISRFEYDNCGNLVKTDYYSQSNSGVLFLYSDSNDIKYELGRNKNVLHYRELSPGINVLLFSEEYVYE